MKHFLKRLKKKLNQFESNAIKASNLYIITKVDI